ncbi:pentapeptide repeat-containing protein, partial [Anabaena sp. CCY 9614]
NLSGANLSGANLSGANLSGANIENARFGNNQGLSESIKRELIQRGAIFEDSSGDHSRILLPK